MAGNFMTALIETYRQYLSLTPQTPIVSLEEGRTPLIPAPSISKMVGAQVFLKFEGANPTGSFKDRGMTMAVSKAKEAGAEAVICASTGNTSAAAAAYSARAKMQCIVLVPKGKVALGKLSQVAITGAAIIEIDGNFDECLTLARTLSDNYKVALVNSLNPHRIEGQKTGAFEIVDELGDAPDFQAMPVGNAGNITAYWAGYKQYLAHQKSTKLPVMLGFQAEGAAPIVNDKPIENPETVATAIRIGNPASWKQACNARDESGGMIAAISDDDILKAYRLLACEEGVFCEPASAIGVAGIVQLAARSFFKPDQRIVCILTGHGLKDPQTAMGMIERVPTMAADAAIIAKHLSLHRRMDP